MKSWYNTHWPLVIGVYSKAIGATSKKVLAFLLSVFATINLYSQIEFNEVSPQPFVDVQQGSVAFADIDDDGDYDVLITGETTSGPVSTLYTNDGTGNFTLVSGTPFVPVSWSKVVFSDVDGDGDQDVLIAGHDGNSRTTNLYVNDGTGSFSMVSGTPFEDLYLAAIGFSDIDRDGDEDVLISGSDNTSQRVTNLYTNDGAGNFTLVPSTPFQGFYAGNIEFFDADMDGDEDVFISGFYRVSYLYLNDGSGNFALSNNLFNLLSNTSSDVSDIDGDSDLDLLVAGQDNFGIEQTDLYVNDGSGNFSLVSGTPFTGVSSQPSVNFADIDRDGDEDVLLSGWTNVPSRITEFYINDGTGNFALSSNTSLQQVDLASNAFADIDGDGDNDVLVTGLSTQSSSRLYTTCLATPPTPSVLFLPDLIDECSVNTPTAPTVVNNCGTVFTGIPDVSFPITSQGTTVVTWTFDDGNGNVTTQTQNIIIDDTTNPIPDIASLADLTESCSMEMPTVPTATDNCAGTIAGISDVTFPITDQRTTLVTWIFDDGNGNVTTQTQNIIIDDTTNPIPDIASLADLTESCSITLAAPTATDNCAQTIMGTTDTEFPITDQGTTVVTWSFDDRNGNVTTQTQNIIIDDTTNPIPDMERLEDLTGSCSISAPTAPTATDNCAGLIMGTADVEFPITNQGTTIVTWTFDDRNGNVTTQTQSVIIDDITNPIPDIESLEDLTGSCSISAPTVPTATDNCAGLIMGTTDVEFPITNQGTTVVTWSFDDRNGNVTTQTQNVIIDDITNPIPDIESLEDLTGSCSINAPTAPTATDNCTGSIIGTSNIEFPIIDQDITKVIWSFDDRNGNITTQTQTITWTTIDISVTVGGPQIMANNSNATYQWLDCEDNNSSIAGETNASFTPLTSGSYAVEITENGCVNISECVTITVLGTSQKSEIELDVYPNPAKNLLQWNDTQDYEVASILDLSGKLVIRFKLEPNQKKIDVDALSNGVYLLELKNDSESSQTRFVKSD